MDNAAPMIAEKGLGGGTDAQTLAQLLAAADGDPCTLGSEALNMVLFLLKQAFGDKHGHGNIAVTVALEHAVEHLLDIFPNSITVRTQDEAALDAGIVNQLSLGAHVGEPLGKVNLHIGDFSNLFFFCHSFHPLAFSNI